MKAFAEYSWQYYFGTIIAVMGTYSFSATKSIISKCVEGNELGKVFALLSSLECLVPIGMSQAYASIWKETSELGSPWVGSVFLVSGTVLEVYLFIFFISIS